MEIVYIKEEIKASESPTSMEKNYSDQKLELELNSDLKTDIKEEYIDADEINQFSECPQASLDNKCYGHQSETKIGSNTKYFKLGVTDGDTENRSSNVIIENQPVPTYKKLKNDFKVEVTDTEIVFSENNPKTTIQNPRNRKDKFQSAHTFKSPKYLKTKTKYKFVRTIQPIIVPQRNYKNCNTFKVNGTRSELTVTQNPTKNQTEEFQLIPALVDHNYFLCKTKQLFCNYCGSEYPTYFELALHIGKPQQCKNCYTHLPSLCQLQQHYRHCYKCKRCDTKFSNQDEYWEHQSSKTECECKACNIKLHNNCILTQHMKAMHKSIKICNICMNENCKDLTASFTCDNCHKRFHSNCLLQFHQRSCFKCKKCNMLLIHDTGLKRHNKILHNHYSCCEELFTTQCELNQHILWRNCTRHSKLVLLNLNKCSICSKQFRCGAALVEHLKEHVEVCEFCDKEFPCKKSMNLHMGVHRCSARCSRPCKLPSHFKINWEECTLCSKQFKTKSELSAHMIWHESFCCSLCNQVFRDKEELEMHTCFSCNEFCCVPCDRADHYKHGLVESSEDAVHNVPTIQGWKNCIKNKLGKILTEAEKARILRAKINLLQQ